MKLQDLAIQSSLMGSEGSFNGWLIQNQNMVSWGINERYRNQHSESGMLFQVICWSGVWMARIWEWDEIEGAFFADKDDLTFCGLKEERRVEKDEMDKSGVWGDNLWI